MLKINTLRLVFLLLIWGASFLHAQDVPSQWSAALEYSLGKTSPANVDFPPLGPQHGILVSIGVSQNEPNKEWKKQLNFPETGFTLSYVQLGNPTYLGSAYTFTPYVSFGVFRSWSSRFSCKVGLGASYFTRYFDSLTNPNNKAIATDFTWAFRSHLYYQLIKGEKFEMKLGLGYFHNSNGHTRLPNNGLNTFLISLSSQVNFKKRKSEYQESSSPTILTRQRFFGSRIGLGRRVLSLYNNDPKDVYAFAASSGIIWNKTFKLGYGVYYRLYKDYYDYIQENGKVVAELYPHYRDNPGRYASNIGLFGSGEILLSHVGLEFEMGLNLYKPSYAFDWQINEEKYKDGAMQLGELTAYYQLKKTIATRLGIKGYLFDTDKAPRHNLFIGAFINANLGQADFTELTLGYQYALPIQVKKKA